MESPKIKFVIGSFNGNIMGIWKKCGTVNHKPYPKSPKKQIETSSGRWFSRCHSYLCSISYVVLCIPMDRLE